MCRYESSPSRAMIFLLMWLLKPQFACVVDFCLRMKFVHGHREAAIVPGACIMLNWRQRCAPSVGDGRSDDADQRRVVQRQHEPGDAAGHRRTDSSPVSSTSTHTTSRVDGLLLSSLVDDDERMMTGRVFMLITCLEMRLTNGITVLIE